MFSKKYVRSEGRYFMQRRICPICDHPIKYGHYCSFCKQWIRNPNYVNATYYLNERHPKNEAHCSYHNAEEEHTNAGAERRKAVRSSSGRERSVKTERAVRTTEKGASGQSKTVSFVYFPDGCDMAVQAAKRYSWFIL